MFADNDPSLYGKTATNLRRKRGIKDKQSQKQSTLCADFTSIVFRHCGFTFWCHLFHLCCWNVRGVHSSLRLNMNTGLWSIAPLFIVPCISLSAHLMSNFERLVPDFLFSSALSPLQQTLLPCKFPWRCDYFFGFRDYFVSNHTDRQAYSISTDRK